MTAATDAALASQDQCEHHTENYVVDVLSVRVRVVIVVAIAVVA
eukprot:SAG31_NODE_23420_length_504_cov_9.451852_1_plen_43_part_10